MAAMKLDPRFLHTRCRPAVFTDPRRNQQLAQRMIRFMRAARALGLSANQIGQDVSVFVMQVNGLTRVCFNAEIVAHDINTVVEPEGCLSFADSHCLVPRFDRIQVQYQTAEGHTVVAELQALESRCFQHELDHTQGITMWQRSQHKYSHVETLSHN